MATSFGATLRDLRNMKGWKRGELAMRAGIKTQTIRKLELGKRTDPYSSTVAKLSDALGVSADDMLAQAGMKKGNSGNPSAFSPKEKEIIKLIRDIQNAPFRQHVLDTILGFAKGAQRPDMEG